MRLMGSFPRSQSQGSSGDNISLMHPHAKWPRLLVVGCRLYMLMHCLFEGVWTLWSALDGLRLSLPSKVKMSTLNSSEFFLLRFCPKTCLSVVWSLVVLALLCVTWFMLLDELFVGVTHWFAGRWTFAQYSVFFPSISFILNNTRLCPDLCSLRLSYIIVRRQGFSHILVADGPSCDWVLA
jgi:hypothetical protein